MPRRQRVAKTRTGQLTVQQRIDLFCNGGRVGAPGVDRRVGVMWDDDEHREAAYWENRDSLLAGFWAGERRFPPAAAGAYDDDPEVLAANEARLAQRHRVEARLAQQRKDRP